MICFVARLALYWHGSDPHNPVAAAVLRLTNPLAAPFRLLAKPSQRVESHVLVAFLLLECVLVWLTVNAGCNAEPSIFQILSFGLIRALRLVLWFHLLAIVAWALMSWFSPSGYNPLVGVLHRICAPVLAPIRRMLPGMGGIDFSPLVFILGAQLALGFLPGAEIARSMNCAPGFSPI